MIAILAPELTLGSKTAKYKVKVLGIQNTNTKKKRGRMSSLDKKINKCLRDLQGLIELQGKTPNLAYKELVYEYEDEDYPPDWLIAVKEAIKIHKEKISGIERLSLGKRLRGQSYENWYSGPKESDNFWPAYVKHLESRGDEWSDAIPSIDESSSSVVSMLPNPGRTEFSGRGLVLGYVQSGKTANMTGVLAKAADRNYRFFIILAGMTDKLRSQTQKRFISDLIGYDANGIWQTHTAPDHDFCEQTSPGFVFGDQYRHIMVVKKNTHVLKRLLNKLENTNEQERKNCAFLIIDDECDQASVNASGYLDKMTTINSHIRSIIDILPRVAYLGYTATPFANLLIDPSVDPTNPEDLYPRDFIFTLPKPNDYFGAERIFGRDMLDADVKPLANESLNILRSIPEEEWDKLRPHNAATRANFDFEVTESLQYAIDYFLLATCVRNVRGDRGKHSSMLVHTTMLVQPQEQIANGIREHLKEMSRDIASVKKRLEDCWSHECEKVDSIAFGLTGVAFDELWEEFEETISSTQVAVENGESNSRVNYDDNDEGKGKRYIVVGGNVLARGLTIEGLVVSFFLRTSAQYCTLMQMGRWFGYRHNFEDLPRIWMTNEMRSNFLDLATVEAEIRYEIEVYENSELTPLDCAVKIRKLPGLAITAKNKMMAAQRCHLSFNGAHRQTRRFYDKNKEVLLSNWNAAVRLLDSVISNGGIQPQSKHGGRLLSRIPVKYIEKFLNDYKIHEKHPDLVEIKSNRTVNHLLEHIKNQNERDGSHSIWNVGVVEPTRNSQSELELGKLGKVNTVNRSCFQRLDNGDADIKALMSKGDLKIDLPDGVTAEKDDWASIKAERMRHEESARPLLLLYVIDRNSEPERASRLKEGGRTSLEAVMDVLGIGIVFPGVDDNKDTVYYVKVDVEEDAEYEDEAWEDKDD